MPSLVVPLPVDQVPSGVFAAFAGVHVWDQDVLQPQVEALVLRGVRQEEEGPETESDEGTENQEEDELLRESQGSPVVREG